jgi:integrase/recombinase XerD
MANYNLPATSKHFKGKLYQRMQDDLHLAGMAQRTIHGYSRAVRRLADFCQLSPDQIDEEQVRQWLIHLKVDCEFAYGSLRVAFSGIKFFYTRTCRRDWKVLAETKLQNVKSLPEVITRDQVQKIINACTTLRMATFFWTVYSLGLRLEEGLNLQVGDIDGERMMVHVHRGKGAKDRYIPLPNSTLQKLREYWKTHRNAKQLFPAEGRNHQGASIAETPMSVTSVQRAIKLIASQLKFGKKVSTHTLRHSYASHLLEAGASLKAIQKYLGHSSLQTTMVYLHLTETAEADTRKLINRLFQFKPKNQ